MLALEVDGLSVRYGHLKAVRNVSFRVETGSATVILGRNGAGKSSLLRAIAGAVKPNSGRVVLFGEDIAHRAPDQRVRRGMVMIPEGRHVFPNLTVRENLILGGFLADRTERERRLVETVDLFPLLDERADHKAGQLSGGQQQILAIARALMAQPRVLLLDEPSLGLAPLVIDEVYDHLARLRKLELTVVLVEQQVHRALDFADQAIVMNLGQVVIEGDAGRMADDPRLMTTYLGEG
jgi:branched-chain amino acid transport system ATP-binding protein